jgi:hypothetical protein
VVDIVVAHFALDAVRAELCTVMLPGSEAAMVQPEGGCSVISVGYLHGQLFLEMGLGCLELEQVFLELV